MSSPRILPRAILAALLAWSAAASAEDAPKPYTAKGVTIPLYGEDRAQPMATVKIATLSLGAQRRGFFRIAALPQALATGVRIELKSAAPRALAGFAPALATLVKTGNAELRELAIFLPGQATPALTADSAMVAPDAPWPLTRVRLADGATHPRATLFVAGEKAGRLAFDHDSITLYPPKD